MAELFFAIRQQRRNLSYLNWLYSMGLLETYCVFWEPNIIDDIKFEYEIWRFYC
jgi:hypothetical protein